MNKYFVKDIEKRIKEMDDWFLEKQCSLPLPNDINIEKDIPYLDDGLNCHKMDIYYTNSTDELKPVIFDFHGGGLLSCERNVNQWFCCEMAKLGFVVFCIDYPLVPQADVYTILKDSYTGVVKAHHLLEQYCGNANRVFLCGDSAGGFIAMNLCAIQNNQAIAESLDITLEQISFKGLATIGGMFYSSKIDKHLMCLLRKDFYGNNYKTHPFWKYVNPEQPAILDNIPPAILITSKKDFLRDYTIRFSKALSSSGRIFVLKDYRENKALTHDFVVLMPETRESHDAINEIATFFNKL